MCSGNASKKPSLVTLGRLLFRTFSVLDPVFFFNMDGILLGKECKNKNIRRSIDLYETIVSIFYGQKPRIKINARCGLVTHIFQAEHSGYSSYCHCPVALSS